MKIICFVLLGLISLLALSWILLLVILWVAGAIPYV